MPPEYPFAIIAGGKKDGEGYNLLLPGDDDGIVRVAETEMRSRLTGRFFQHILPQGYVVSPNPVPRVRQNREKKHDCRHAAYVYPLIFQYTRQSGCQAYGKSRHGEVETVFEDDIGKWNQAGFHRKGEKKPEDTEGYQSRLLHVEDREDENGCKKQEGEKGLPFKKAV